MIKKNKGKVIISSVIILLPILAGLILWNKLPDGFGAKGFNVFGLPLILFALHLLCLVFTSFDKRQADQNPKALSIIFWIIPFISFVSNGILYSVILNKRFDPFVFMPLMLGIMFVFIGNYLPKTKQNSTLGIRILWTLGNEENWNKTHRFSGKVWVAGGLILLLSAFLPAKLVIAVSILVLVTAVIVPIIYSYCIYKKHKKEGISYASMPRSKKERNSVIISLALVVIILIALTALMFTGKVDISCEESTVKINASYWSDIEINYSEIENIEYRTDLNAGMRVYGFGSGKLLLGTFSNDELGNYTRYTYTGNDACIVMRIDGETLVIGAKTDAETKALYENILTKMK